jgi:hypothetical protein
LAAVLVREFQTLAAQAVQMVALAGVAELAREVPELVRAVKAILVELRVTTPTNIQVQVAAGVAVQGEILLAMRFLALAAQVLIRLQIGVHLLRCLARQV